MGNASVFPIRGTPKMVDDPAAFLDEIRHETP